MKRGRMMTCRHVLLAVAIPWLACSRGGAEEPAREFLDGLRARGYHDVAIDYLKSLETSRLAPSEMRQVLAYERALTLVAASRKERDLEQRFALLDQAQALLREFIGSQGSHPKAYAARSQLGNLIVERARIKVEESKSGGADEDLNQARKLYDQAFEEFAKLEASVTAELDQIPKVLDLRDREEAKMAARRKQLRADNLQTELLAAAIREESADTVPDGSKEHIAYLTEAAGLYDAIYKKYRSRLAGLYARMYQGRCNHRLGKTKDALGYYGELLDQPSEPESFWNLKAKTLRLAMESWLAPQERKYFEAIKRGVEWVNSAPRNTERNPDMLAIRLSLARAFQMQADAYKKRDPKDARTINKSLDEALKHASFVAGEPGSLQEDAQELAVELGGRRRADLDAAPATFTEAQRAGKKALDEVGPASEEVSRIAQRLRRAGAKDRAAIQTELQVAQGQLAAAQDESLQSYRLAMRLADRDTPPSELNLVRYFVCYLYYLKQQFWDAALVGDFVSERYPRSAGAKQCAKISLACYLRLLELAEDGSNDSSAEFEQGRVAMVARLIAETWPDTPEAVESLSTVVPVMVNAGDLSLARDLTLMLPEASPERGVAELVTGQAMWGTFLQRQQAATVDSGSSETEADALLAEQATELLKDGYKRLGDQADVNVSTATAMLSLAQALVAQGDASQAVEVLEHNQVGPLVLVDAGHEAASNPIFIQEAFRTSLQAYIGSMETDPAGRMQKAKQSMTALRDAVGDDAAGKQRMLAIYINLAQSIESQMSAAEPETKSEMSKVFEAFLEELSAGSSEVGVLNWVAETFSSLGKGFDTNPEVLDPDAAGYYDRSIAAFQNLLSRGDLQPQVATQIQARMAAVKTQKHDYAGAMADLQRLLAQSPNAVNLQVEAAGVLQKWGGVEPSKYTEAIAGINAREKGGVWGWGKIANAVMPHPQFRDTFFQARYEMAACQVGIASSKNGADKTKQLQAAQRTLTTTKKLYPSLGGATWQKKYDALLSQISSNQVAR
ncbi:MAG: hypothetical protein ACR2NZ_23900 [Rubripirellula sp.]